MKWKLILIVVGIGFAWWYFTKRNVASVVPTTTNSGGGFNPANMEE